MALVARAKWPVDSSHEPKTALRHWLEPGRLSFPVHGTKDIKKLSSDGSVRLKGDSSEFMAKGFNGTPHGQVNEVSLYPLVFLFLHSDMRMAAPVTDGVAVEVDGVFSSIADGMRFLLKKAVLTMR